MSGPRITFDDATMVVPVGAGKDGSDKTALSPNPIGTSYRHCSWSSFEPLVTTAMNNVEGRTADSTKASSQAPDGPYDVSLTTVSILHSNLRVTESVISSEAPAPSPHHFQIRIKSSKDFETWQQAAKIRAAKSGGLERADMSASYVSSVLNGDVSTVDGTAVFLCQLSSGNKALGVLFCDDSAVRNLELPKLDPKKVPDEQKRAIQLEEFKFALVPVETQVFSVKFSFLGKDETPLQRIALIGSREITLLSLSSIAPFQMQRMNTEEAQGCESISGYHPEQVVGGRTVGAAIFRPLVHGQRGTQHTQNKLDAAAAAAPAPYRTTKSKKYETTQHNEDENDDANLVGVSPADEAPLESNIQFLWASFVPNRQLPTLVALSSDGSLCLAEFSFSAENSIQISKVFATVRIPFPTETWDFICRGNKMHKGNSRKYLFPNQVSIVGCVADNGGACFIAVGNAGCFVPLPVNSTNTLPVQDNLNSVFSSPLPAHGSPRRNKSLQNVNSPGAALFNVSATTASPPRKHQENSLPPSSVPYLTACWKETNSAQLGIDISGNSSAMRQAPVVRMPPPIRVCLGVCDTNSVYSAQAAAFHPSNTAVIVTLEKFRTSPRLDGLEYSERDRQSSWTHVLATLDGSTQSLPLIECCEAAVVATSQLLFSSSKGNRPIKDLLNHTNSLPRPNDLRSASKSLVRVVATNPNRSAYAHGPALAVEIRPKPCKNGDVLQNSMLLSGISVDESLGSLLRVQETDITRLWVQSCPIGISNQLNFLSELAQLHSTAIVAAVKEKRFGINETQPLGTRSEICSPNFDLLVTRAVRFRDPVLALAHHLTLGASILGSSLSPAVTLTSETQKFFMQVQRIIFPMAHLPFFRCRIRNLTTINDSQVGPIASSSDPFVAKLPEFVHGVVPNSCEDVESWLPRAVEPLLGQHGVACQDVLALFQPVCAQLLQIGGGDALAWTIAEVSGHPYLCDQVFLAIISRSSSPISPSGVTVGDAARRNMLEFCSPTLRNFYEALQEIRSELAKVPVPLRAAAARLKELKKTQVDNIHGMSLEMVMELITRTEIAEGPIQALKCCDTFLNAFKDPHQDIALARKRLQNLADRLKSLGAY